MKRQPGSWMWKSARAGQPGVWNTLSWLMLLLLMGFLLPAEAPAGDMGKDYNIEIYKQIQREQQMKWYAACNTEGRYVVLGKAPLPQSPRHVILAGPFNDEPSARAWVNNNCPSWRCDYDGRCLPPESSGSGSRSVPPPSDSGGTGGGLFGQ